MNTIALMGDVVLPDGYTGPDYPHATVLYMGKPENFDNYDVVIDALADATVEAIENLDRLTAKAYQEYTFATPNSDGKYPHVLLLDSKDLLGLHTAVYNDMVNSGYVPESEFVAEKYVPHITLGFVDEVLAHPGRRVFHVLRDQFPAPPPE